jgi:hypothetical protein
MNNRSKISEIDQKMVEVLRKTIIDASTKLQGRKRVTSDALRSLAQLVSSYHKLSVSLGMLKSVQRYGGSGSADPDMMKTGDPDYYEALERAGK